MNMEKFDRKQYLHGYNTRNKYLFQFPINRLISFRKVASLQGIKRFINLLKCFKNIQIQDTMQSTLLGTD